MDSEMMVRMLQLQLSQKTIDNSSGVTNSRFAGVQDGLKEGSEFDDILSSMLEKSFSEGEKPLNSTITPGLRTRSTSDYILNIKASIKNNIQAGFYQGVYNKPSTISYKVEGTVSASKDLKLLVEQAANKYGLSPKLLDAVVRSESDYNIKAVSTSGAMGLMQLMPDTAEYLGVKNPFNPRENLEGGARYLKSLIDKYNGSIKLALAAYNAGPSTVDRYRGVPPYPETIAYINKINSLSGGGII
ncbi:MAG: lytic transglycosylase domain-containing protein [Peptococcaceae bacterium]|nr:lytic transglycosylase domain-containing protein [Peptococcaceae bacterium]